MPAASSQSQRLRVAHLNPRGPTAFDLRPTGAERAQIAADLGIGALPAARLTGEIAPHAGEAWALTGRLQARVVQPCVVTLEPVETAIDEPVQRIYSPHLHEPDDEMAAMLDDALEPLGNHIDLGAVLHEALALALPLYPRAAGAAEAAPPPTETPEEAAGDRRRPFADLGKLLKGD